MCFDSGNKCLETGEEEPEFRLHDLVNKYRDSTNDERPPRFVDIRQDYKNGRSFPEWTKYTNNDTSSRDVWNRGDSKMEKSTNLTPGKSSDDHEDYLPMNIGKKFDKLRYFRTQGCSTEE